MLSNNSLVLQGGVYSFIASSPGFKSDKIEMIVNAAKVLRFVMIPDKIDENDVKILLTWNGNVSLDLRTKFILNSEIGCEVSYTNKVCGGIKLLNISEFQNFGFEELVIKPVGAYQYFFYVVQKDPIDYSAALKVYVKGEILPIFNFVFGTQYMWDLPSYKEYKI